MMGCVPCGAQPSISCHPSPVSLSVWCLTTWSLVTSFRFFLPSPPSRCTSLSGIILLCRALPTSTSCPTQWESPEVLPFLEKTGEPLVVPLLPSWSTAEEVGMHFFLLFLAVTAPPFGSRRSAVISRQQLSDASAGCWRTLPKTLCALTVLIFHLQ